MNVINKSILKYFPKYGDYFGNVLMMGYENLGLEFSTFDENEWSYKKKLSYAARNYYWRYRITVEEALVEVKLECSDENIIAMGKLIKEYFGEDCYFHFIMKGRDKFYHCEQRQEKDNKRSE